MSQTILGTFSTRHGAREAAQELVQLGILPEQVSLLPPMSPSDHPPDNPDVIAADQDAQPVVVSVRVEDAAAEDVLRALRACRAEHLESRSHDAAGSHFERFRQEAEPYTASEYRQEETIVRPESPSTPLPGRRP